MFLVTANKVDLLQTATQVSKYDLLYLFSEAVYCISCCLASFILPLKSNVASCGEEFSHAPFLLISQRQICVIYGPRAHTKTTELLPWDQPGYQLSQDACILVNQFHSTWSGHGWTILTSQAHVNLTKLLIPEPQCPHLYNEVSLLLELLPIIYDSVFNFFRISPGRGKHSAFIKDQV